MLHRLFEGRRWLFWVFCVATLVADQVTKVMLWRPPAARQEPLVLVPRVLQIISHPGNTKGALGLGPQSPVFYVVAACVGLAVVVYFLLTTPPSQGLMAAALGMLAGGAVGNIVDRVAFRYVRDFIDLHWDDVFHWHTFNVADAAICVGFAFILLATIFEHKKTGTAE